MAHRLRIALLTALLAVCALAGAWTAPRVVGPATYSTDVADLRLQVGVSPPAERGVNLYVPLADWGLRAPVVDAPLKVGVEPRRINRIGVVRAVTGDESASLAELRSQLDDALKAAALRAALLALAGALVGGLVAALLWHALGVRGPRRLVLAPLGGLALTLVVIGGLVAWSALSWSPDRLERPDYYASGVELERILDQADALRRSGEKYSDRVDSSIRSIAGLLDDKATTGPLGGEAPGGDTRRVVLASDIHNNLLALPALRRYSSGHPTVLAGDFTINGGKMETPFVNQMATLGNPVAAVSGNHDSPGTMHALAKRGVDVLTHSDGVQSFAGLRVVGFEDPLAFAGSAFPSGLRAGLSFGDLPDGHERYLRAVQRRWEWWQALPERPQVLVVHQEAIGRALANLIWKADPDGAPLTVLVGHTHRQRMDRYGPITVVNGGSAGAGGVFGLGRESIGFALLDFDRAGALTATDLVAMTPSTSAARARRVITDSPDCDDTLVFCHDEPKLPDPPGTPKKTD